jgi:hypothetical protein
VGDDLTISGGGSTAVATDELFASAQALGALAAEAAALRVHLATIDRLVTPHELQMAEAPASAVRAELDIDQAAAVLVEVELGAKAVKWGLEIAADGYGFVELFADRLLGEFAGDFAGLAGRLLPGLLLSALPGAAAGAATLFAGAALSPGGLDGFRQRLGALARENNELVTNPLTVALVRHAAMSGDDALLGFLGVPMPIADLLDDGGLGVAGTAVASATAMKLGSAGGVFVETPVRLGDSRVTTVDSAPTGFAERLARVPDTDETNGAQVRIEKYSQPGQPDRFEVYVAGTVTFSPVATTEPWDMTSNMSNAIGGGGGSYDAVVQAMQLAGIDADSPVQLTGYSQGGATAALLAASGDYNVEGLATFGAPAGQIAVPASIPAVIVEHTDDIVPALGGTQVNQQAVIVERNVFAGREIPTEYAVPAHHYEYYAETAELMDQARSEQLTDAVARLDAFGQGAVSVTSTDYRFVREPVSGLSGGR